MKYFIIDFDSTIVSFEGLEVLAEVALAKNPDRKKILEEIKEITQKGMNGELEFTESLTKRLALLSATKTDLEKATSILKKNITSSIARNKDFFKKFSSSIYIISGGFKEFIYPVVKSFGILEGHIFANEFVFDLENKIVDFNHQNFLAQENGKVKAVSSLNLDGEIFVIGDGYTDYLIKKALPEAKFIAFTENIAREVVTKNADHIAPSFDEFLYVNKLPMSLSYPKSRIKVLLLENIDPQAAQAFKEEGFQVELLKGALDEEELVKKIKDVHVLGVRSKTKVTKKVLGSAGRLLAIGTFSVGFDNVDLQTASKLGVAVFNAPYQNTRSVVELVIGDLIMLFRRVFEKSEKLHSGIWDKSVDNCFEVKGKTLGIIGYGNIGTQISVIAENLGMEVYFYDVIPRLALGNAKKCSSLDELFKKSDAITVHVAGTKNNSNLISQKEFKKMKDGVIFINLSRGFIVDLEALAKNVKSGKVGGAAIDVFPNEPKKTGDSFKSVLQGLPNVILTPHIGGNTVEAQGSIGEYVSSKLIEFINTGNSFLSVNLPNIQPQQTENSHRLLHLHKNVPGILAQINNILASNGVNILGQYLKTNDSIGYVITDVNKEYEKKVLNELKTIPNTIRFRVLY